jgi:histidinol dehydrogenase
LVTFIEISSTDPESLEKAFGLYRSSFPSEVETSVKKIIDDVRMRGDEAVVEYTLRFDQVNLDNSKIQVEEGVIEKALTSLSEEESQALDVMIERVKRFHRNEVEKTWFFCDEIGSLLGQIVKPIQRVGIYVPGGKAPYPSTLVMNSVPAIVAGVKEIAVCVPPEKDGEINRFILAACAKVGIKEVYRVGGAQAIAALAFGTETIKPVDLIAGPGNIYVTVAKKILYGEVGIDTLAGPSEVVVLADETADPLLVASDLLSQAEHGEDSKAFLVTSSKELAEKVKEDLEKLVQELEMGNSVLSQIFIALVPKGKEVEVVDFIAPEHLEILTEEPLSYLEEVNNAGAIFIGESSPVSAGDYIAGPSHTLPTGRAARFSSPLSVTTFLKRNSVIFLSSHGIKSLSSYIEKLAQIEGFKAHAYSAKLRREKGS